MHMKKEMNADKQRLIKKGKVKTFIKKALYAVATVLCLLIVLDTARELYFILSQEHNEGSLRYTMRIIRKILAMLGWGLLTWYAANKCFNKNGR